MGFFDTITGRQHIPVVERQPNVQVTSVGDIKLKQGMVSGMEFDVLATIKKLQPCTAEEVTKDIGKFAESKIRYTMRALHSKGWIEILK